jgi:hypothetical protein
MSKVKEPPIRRYKVRGRGRNGLDVAIPIEWAQDRGLKRKEGRVEWRPHPDPDCLVLRIVRKESKP